MDFLQQREWGLMILDGMFTVYKCTCIALECVIGSYCDTLSMHISTYCCSFLSAEVQTCPADKFRRTLSGKCLTYNVQTACCMVNLNFSLTDSSL